MTTLRWEYKAFNYSSTWTGKLDTEELERVLNEFGREGWELVNAPANLTGNGLTLLLKRER